MLSAARVQTVQTARGAYQRLRRCCCRGAGACGAGRTGVSAGRQQRTNAHSMWCGDRDRQRAAAAGGRARRIAKQEGEGGALDAPRAVHVAQPLRRLHARHVVGRGVERSHSVAGVAARREGAGVVREPLAGARRVLEEMDLLKAGPRYAIPGTVAQRASASVPLAAVRTGSLEQGWLGRTGQRLWQSQSY